VALDLAAGGARDAAELEQPHRVHVDEAMHLGQFGQHARRQALGAGLATGFDFLQQHEPRALRRVDGKRRAARRAEGWVQRFDAGLHVLRVNVGAAEDHDVLHAADHVQLAASHEAEVAGAQPVVARQPAERGVCVVAAVSTVAARDRRAVHPDLAHAVVRLALQ
jgi:hypothetical protein